VEIQFRPEASGPRGDKGQPQSGASVDFQSFLRLLTAQLRNQDPLSPLDSTQFVAQLASFSTVEQLVSANARLEEIGGSLRRDEGISDHTHWIGRTAEIPGLPARFEGIPIRMHVEPSQGADRTEVLARRADGTELSRTLIESGGGVFDWNPVGVRPGELLTFTAIHTFDDGSIESASVATFSEITGVRSTTGGVELLLANGFTAPAVNVRGLSR
jgi:flagellar basal-body rod modification protein FlgD